MPRAPPWKAKQTEWLQSCSDRMLSRGTIDTYRWALNSFYKYANANGILLNPATIEPGHVREFYYHLVDSGIKTATQQSYTNALLLFLRYCQNQKCATIKMRISVSRTHVNWLDEMEVARFISAAQYPQLRGALVLMAYCGLRRGEVVNLLWKNVGANQLSICGKGRKERTIPLDMPFWSAMRPYTEWAKSRPRSDHFIAYEASKGVMRGYAEGTLSMLVRDHGRSIGMDVTAHTLRRSFGRHLYKRGCPLAELQTLMGHSSVEMTIRYLGIGNEDISHAMRFRPDYLGNKN